jgi:hypothetical protein
VRKGKIILPKGLGERSALSLSPFSLTEKNEREKKAVSYFAGRIFEGLSYFSF